MGFFADFVDLMTDELVVQPGALDLYGTFVPSGASIALTCRIEGKARMVRDPSNGQEVVSSVQVFVEASDLTTDEHRYTLPARFEPRTNLRAIAIEKYDDESGPCYEKVMFP